MYIRNYFNLDIIEKKFISLSVTQILNAIKNIDSRKIITNEFDNIIVGFQEKNNKIIFFTLETYENSGEAFYKEPKNLNVEDLINILQNTNPKNEVFFEEDNIFFINDDPYSTTLKFANDGYAFLKEKDILNLNQKVILKTKKD